MPFYHGTPILVIEKSALLRNSISKSQNMLFPQKVGGGCLWEVNG